MSRFNATANPYRPDTENLAGGQAFSESPRLELVSLLLTSFLEDKFYESASDRMVRLRSLIDALPDKSFAAKAGIMAREWGMRSVTHVTAAELCRAAKGQPWLKPAVSRMIQRPDDATEMLSYWLTTYGKPIPNALKRGIACGLSRFSEYQLAKYRGEGHALKLVDTINLVHAHSDAIDKLMRGTLEAPDTWEVAITRAGSDAEAKADEWRRLVREKQLGYFALLRNLRNMEQACPDVLDDVCEQLTDREAIKRSKVLPFRFTTAIEQVSDRRLLVAVARAADLALDNLPVLPGKTMVALDLSGSMQGKPLQIGSLFAAALAKTSDCEVLGFGTRAGWLRVNPADTVTTIAGALRANMGGTDFNLIFQAAQRSYDRIIILSDMQAWVGYHAPIEVYKDYKRRTAADPAIWSFDLQGHGTLQFPARKVYALAGWSEKVFDLIPLLEAGTDALVRKVEAVAL